MARLTPEELAEKYAAKEKRIKDKMEGGNFLSLEDGKNYVRIFANPSDGAFFLEGGQHFGLDLLGCKDADGKVVKAAFCPQKFSGDLHGPCPICELLSKLKSKPDKASGTAVVKCKAKDRYFAWAYLMTAETYDLDSIPAGEEAGVLPFGDSVLRPLLGYWRDPDYGDFTDPENGFTMIIEKSGGGLNTEYSVMARRNPSAFETPDLVPLEERIPPKTYDELCVLLGLSEDEAPPQRSSKPKEQPSPRHAAPRQREEEEEEEAKPAHRSPKGVSSPKLPLQEEGEEAVVDAPPQRRARSARPVETPPSQDSSKPKSYAGLAMVDGHPECFGEGYNVRQKICQECPWKKDCREKLLSDD